MITAWGGKKEYKIDFGLQKWSGFAEITFEQRLVRYLIDIKDMYKPEFGKQDYSGNAKLGVVGT